MTTWSAAPAVTAFLRRAQRRLRWLAAAWGAAIGLAAAILALLVLRHRLTPAAAAAFTAGAVLAGIGAALWWLRRGRSVAQRVEERTPESRNVVLTAAELLAQPERVRPHIGDAVCAAAGRVLGNVRPAAVFPTRPAAAALAGTAALWTLTFLSVTGAAPAVLPQLRSPLADAPAIARLEVVVVPPAYTGRSEQRLRDPRQIEALAGSRLEVTVRASADAVILETLAGRSDMVRAGGNTFRATVVADADGFIALEPRDSARGRSVPGPLAVLTDSTAGPPPHERNPEPVYASAPVAGLRRLVGLRVTPDERPRIRITAPGKDLVLPDGEAAIAVELDAVDDLGLASLRLTFTRVSGFGEQFTFMEGEVPLQVTRRDERSWSGRARWPLQPLGLTAGDMLVYRARATDRRPGAGPGESDAYMIEVVAANAVASGGLALDEEFDRYALSQQMVILLTERLIARRSSLRANELVAEAEGLAAAQRRVRAEFVFMLGGELEDEPAAGADPDELHEEAHIRADADLAEGRMANQGRIELSRAVQAMSAAAALLGKAQLDTALVAERRALEHVQRAFARTRYILRALTQRERLDPSRRLTGLLAGTGIDLRPVREPPVDPQLETLRRSLADIAALAAAPAGAEAAAGAIELAQRILRTDPSSGPLREVADALGAAAAAFAHGSAADARAHTDRALSTVATQVRAALPPAPLERSLPVQRLEGAMADALRNLPTAPPTGARR